ncbi:MAG: hypothetical protein KME52_27880 [Desmonostoc geniculatum HA4340-LM1]|jgi:hypothetical protein|nr:hypothetical protein [Desmonostoc geniculatum HA4340-LM1]
MLPNYFYKEGSCLHIVQGCSAVPENVEEFCKLEDAIGHVQWLGCARQSQHVIRNEYHALVLEVLAWSIENQGELFPEIYRGVRSLRPDTEYKILFGTRDIEVAKFYGDTIKTYANIRGIKVRISTAKSVKTDSWDETDDEIIFFP